MLKNGVSTWEFLSKKWLLISFKLINFDIVQLPILTDHYYSPLSPPLRFDLTVHLNFLLLLPSWFCQKHLILAHLFVEIPRPEDSEVTFLVFESSFYQLPPA